MAIVKVSSKFYVVTSKIQGCGVYREMKIIQCILKKSHSMYAPLRKYEDELFENINMASCWRGA